MAKSNLTYKQQRFIEEYLVDLNAKQAAIRAGYSKKTAKAIGCENLTKPNLAAEIERRQAEIRKETGITQQRVLQEYAKIAFLDPTEFFNQDGSLKQIHNIPKDVAAAIGGFDQVTRRIGGKKDPEYEDTKKIKLIDKKGALDSISRHLGMFEADNRRLLDHTGDVKTEAILTLDEATQIYLDKLK